MNVRIIVISPIHTKPFNHLKPVCEHLFLNGIQFYLGKLLKGPPQQLHKGTSHPMRRIVS